MPETVGLLGCMFMPFNHNRDPDGREFTALVTERLDFEIRSGRIGVRDLLGQWMENTRIEQHWNAFGERKFRQRYREHRTGHLLAGTPGVLDQDRSPFPPVSAAPTIGTEGYPDSLAPMPSLSEPPNWPATITTNQLTLRPAHEDDVEIYRKLWTEPAVRRHLGGPVEGERLTVYERGYTHRPYFFSVVTNDSAEMVGTVSIDQASHFGRREISYSFLPEHWGHGYAREAVKAALEWAFDAVPSEDPSIIAVTQEANTRSRSLLEKLGMEQFDSFVEFNEPQAAYSMTPVEDSFAS